MAALAAALSLSAPAWAQTSGVVAAVTPPKTVGKRGAVMEARVTVQLRNGYHVNSNTPRAKANQLQPMTLKLVVLKTEELTQFSKSNLGL